MDLEFVDHEDLLSFVRRIVEVIEKRKYKVAKVGISREQFNTLEWLGEDGGDRTTLKIEVSW